MSRYSTGQLIAAKCAVVLLAAIVLGPESLGPLIVGLALYEGASWGLAHLMASIPRLRGARRAAPFGETSPSAPTSLRRAEVGKALLAYLAGQVLVLFIVGLIAASRAGGTEEARVMKELARLIPIAMPLSLIASGLALLLVLRRWQARLGPANLAETLGLSWGTRAQLGRALTAGMVLALLAMPLVGALQKETEPPDLTTQLATSSPAALRAWIISAVLLAPPIEELMFRGVFLGGLAQSWSLRASAVLSGLTFWAMHGPEFVHWPAAVSIGLLTILATLLRVRTRALGPSIAAHFGYNLMIATMVSVAMTYEANKVRWAGAERNPMIMGALPHPLVPWPLLLPDSGGRDK